LNDQQENNAYLRVNAPQINASISQGTADMDISALSSVQASPSAQMNVGELAAEEMDVDAAGAGVGEGPSGLPGETLLNDHETEGAAIPTKPATPSPRASPSLPATPSVASVNAGEGQTSTSTGGGLSAGGPADQDIEMELEIDTI